MKPRPLPLVFAASFAACFAAGVSLPAFAQSPPGAPRTAPGKFAQLDTNHDGMISREEAQVAPRVAKHFDVIDVNRDGYLTPLEFSAYLQKRRMDAFKALDQDGDDRISRPEAQHNRRLAAQFDAIDTDKDGYISSGELVAFKKARKAAVQ